MDYGLDICEADPCARHGAIPTMVDPGYAMRRDDEQRPDSSGNVAPFWILSHEAKFPYGVPYQNKRSDFGHVFGA
jgi:hypothetical protein